MPLTYTLEELEGKIAKLRKIALHLKPNFRVCLVCMSTYDPKHRDHWCHCDNDS